ncbi:hypothetical protein DFP72DRAFT_1170752 [Ephemerocybe angulata]|uniref:DEAD/DEAH box helicase domain-containing protein n=1 Tax=Ephemerocybe angulata TaxID=980116 RepID=A0A8H6M313_9AGAR|nr:hypothetical protein DFP72DRAFT_1170752 [Tulosesus angulatus]
MPRCATKSTVREARNNVACGKCRPIILGNRTQANLKAILALLPSGNSSHLQTFPPRPSASHMFDYSEPLPSNRFGVPATVEWLDASQVFELVDCHAEVRRCLKASGPVVVSHCVTFPISILQQLDMSIKGTQALILAPTHELAQQIQKVVIALGDYMRTWPSSRRPPTS